MGRRCALVNWRWSTGEDQQQQTWGGPVGHRRKVRAGRWLCVRVTNSTPCGSIPTSPWGHNRITNISTGIEIFPGLAHFHNYGLVLAFLHVVATNSTPNPRHPPSLLPVRPWHQHGREVEEVKVRVSLSSMKDIGAMTSDGYGVK